MSPPQIILIFIFIWIFLLSLIMLAITYELSTVSFYWIFLGFVIVSYLVFLILQYCQDDEMDSDDALLIPTIILPHESQVPIPDQSTIRSIQNLKNVHSNDAAFMDYLK
eukprot:NODE_210_length_12844_cov_1.045822.p13 type:complete len:109 gc:universal NODE_210_length_12844_cov_1.045822:6606-6932(+)